MWTLGEMKILPQYGEIPMFILRQYTDIRARFKKYLEW